MTRVVMIHTVDANAKLFGDLVQEIAPGLPTEHVVDESLLTETIEAGTLTDAVRQRFRRQAEAAKAAGADVVLLTCSSVGPAADGLGDELGITVLRIDEAMADRAVQLGSKIGVAATLPTTLLPTADLIERAAASVGKQVDVTTRLAEGAFQALRSGDPATHDALVTAALRELGASVDAIVLAQASMARAVGGADAIEVHGRAVPILTSPRLGVERLREIVQMGASI